MRNDSFFSGMLYRVSNSNGVNSNIIDQIRNALFFKVSNSNGVNSNMALQLLILLSLGFKLQRSKF